MTPKHMVRDHFVSRGAYFNSNNIIQVPMTPTDPPKTPAVTNTPLPARAPTPTVPPPELVMAVPLVLAALAPAPAMKLAPTTAHPLQLVVTAPALALAA